MAAMWMAEIRTVAELSECPRCHGNDITIRAATLDGKVLYRILECKDCHDAEIKRMIDETIANRPDVAERYSKKALRTDYYATVSIKDLEDC